MKNFEYKKNVDSCSGSVKTPLLSQTNRVLRDDEYFTDVTLATEGHSVKAHRVILSACSNYFHAILKTMRPWQHPVLVLQDVKSADLNSLMDFIYFGQVSNGTAYPFSIFYQDLLQLLFQSWRNNSPSFCYKFNPC